MPWRIDCDDGEDDCKDDCKEKDWWNQWASFNMPWRASLYSIHINIREGGCMFLVNTLPPLPKALQLRVITLSWNGAALFNSTQCKRCVCSGRRSQQCFIVLFSRVLYSIHRTFFFLGEEFLLIDYIQQDTATESQQQSTHTENTGCTVQNIKSKPSHTASKNKQGLGNNLEET